MGSSDSRSGSSSPAEPFPGPHGSGVVQSQIEESALLRELVEKHSDRLQRFIVKHIGNTTEAEELAQQAFVEAAASFKAFRGDSQLSSWLYGIALNLVRNYLSRAPERRYDFVSDANLESESSPDLTPEQQAEQNQTMALLRDSISELPENMQEILLMVGIEEISYEEAAALLTVPVGTVRSRLSRARAALREKLRQKGLTIDL
jgi:RNA polymerase sigma-70 factor (ECF subfamily)